MTKFRAAGWGDFARTRALKRGTPLRNRYFTAIYSTSMRTVADRHRLAAYHNKHWWRAFRGYQNRWHWTTLNMYCAWTPKIGVLAKFAGLRSGCDAYISRVECAEITGDRPRQPAYEIFSIIRIFNSRLRPPRFKKSPFRGRQIWIPLQNALILLHVVHWFARWQHRCCRASHEH